MEKIINKETVNKYWDLDSNLNIISNDDGIKKKISVYIFHFIQVKRQTPTQ